MPSRFDILVLTDRAVLPDMAELSEALTERYPALGPVRADPEGAPRSLDVDGARLQIAAVELRAPIMSRPGGLKPARRWDPGPALKAHRAHLKVSCVGPGTGRYWMRALATVATASATIIARMTEARALFVPSAGTFLAPKDAVIATETALRGVSPIEAWVALAAVTPANIADDRLKGAATDGLRAFTGHELELAPAEATARDALDRLYGLTWMALDGDEPLRPGPLHQPGGEAGAPAMLCRADAWLRPGVPALVLVPPGSPVDPESLALPGPPAPDLREQLRETTHALITRLSKHPLVRKAPPGHPRSEGS